MNTIDTKGTIIGQRCICEDDKKEYVTVSEPYFISLSSDEYSDRFILCREVETGFMWQKNLNGLMFIND